MSTPDQLDMFDLAPPQKAPAAPPPPRRKPGKRPPQRPEMVCQVLSDVELGRLGLLDDTDRVVAFEDSERIRVALDVEDTVLSLLREGYLKRGPDREVVSRLHGVIRKPVTPLRITKSGHKLRERWSALKPLPPRSSVD